jgi:hypothetical protein
LAASKGSSSDAPGKAADNPATPGVAVSASPAAATTSEQDPLAAVAEQLRQKRIKDLTSPNRTDWSTNSSVGTTSTPASTVLPASAASITEQLRLKRLKDLGQ